jgi:hypothetical protein
MSSGRWKIDRGVYRVAGYHLKKKQSNYIFLNEV